MTTTLNNFQKKINGQKKTTASQIINDLISNKTVKITDHPKQKEKEAVANQQQQQQQKKKKSAAAFSSDSDSDSDSDNNNKVISNIEKLNKSTPKIILRRSSRIRRVKKLD